MRLVILGSVGIAADSDAIQWLRDPWSEKVAQVLYKIDLFFRRKGGKGVRTDAGMVCIGTLASWQIDTSMTMSHGLGSFRRTQQGSGYSILSHTFDVFWALGVFCEAIAGAITLILKVFLPLLEHSLAVDLWRNFVWTCLKDFIWMIVLLCPSCHWVSMFKYCLTQPRTAKGIFCRNCILQNLMAVASLQKKMFLQTSFWSPYHRGAKLSIVEHEQKEWLKRIELIDTCGCLNDWFQKQRKKTCKRMMESSSSRCILYDETIENETMEMSKFAEYLRQNHTARASVSHKFLLSAFIMQTITEPTTRFGAYLLDLRSSVESTIPEIPLFWTKEDKAESKGLGSRTPNTKHNKQRLAMLNLTKVSFLWPGSNRIQNWRVPKSKTVFKGAVAWCLTP